MATDTTNNKIDLLQKFIDNEKNAKRWTIISVTLFCLLAFAIIFLAGKLKKVQEKNDELELKLAKATLIQVDSTNFDLVSRFEKINTAYDSLQKITNSLLINLAELKKEKPGEDVVSKNDAIIDKATQEKIKKLITPANIKDIQEKEIKYTVYIQYTKEFSDQAGKIRNSTKEYVWPEPELIRTNSFDPAVHYFYPGDSREAIKLATLAGKVIGLPVKVSFLKMKTPKKQLELWLGKYQPKTTEQIFKKYDVQQIMLEQKKQ